MTKILQNIIEKFLNQKSKTGSNAANEFYLAMVQFIRKNCKSEKYTYTLEKVLNDNFRNKNLL